MLQILILVFRRRGKKFSNMVVPFTLVGTRQYVHFIFVVRLLRCIFCNGAFCAGLPRSDHPNSVRPVIFPSFPSTRKHDPLLVQTAASQLKLWRRPQGRLGMSLVHRSRFVSIPISVFLRWLFFQRHDVPVAVPSRSRACHARVPLLLDVRRAVCVFCFWPWAAGMLILLTFLLSKAIFVTLF